MTYIFPTIVSIFGFFVGILMAMNIMTVANIDLMNLWIPLTISLAVGCAFLFNFKRPVVKENTEE